MSEREAFEAWAFENGLQSHTDQSLDYPLGNVLWKCWQGRAAIEAQRVPDGLKDARDFLTAVVGAFGPDGDGTSFTAETWDKIHESISVLLAAAPPVAQPASQHVPEVHFGKTMKPETLRSELQKKCSAWGTYWRGPDAHGVELTTEQAVELLQNALNVEVEIKGEEPEQAQLAEARKDAERWKRLVNASELSFRLSGLPC